MFIRQNLKMRVGSKLFVLLALGLTLVSSCGSNRPERGIKLDTQNINLGVVYLDSAVRNVDVGFTNIGKQNLVIKKIMTDCDCTSGTFSPEPVSSGDKGVLRIKVDLSRFFPQQIEKNVAVYSNATEQPIMISVKGYVRYKK